MPRYHFAADETPDWAPLERLCRLCRESSTRSRLDPDEFMYMGRVVAAQRPPIHLYKHVHTRRYLNLDDAGHTFRVRWRSGLRSADIEVASCLPHRDPVRVLDAFRFGLPDTDGFGAGVTRSDRPVEVSVLSATCPALSEEAAA